MSGFGQRAGTGENPPGGAVGQQGGSRGRGRPLRLAGGGGGLSGAAGRAAAGRGVPVVAEVGQAGAAGVTGAVAWRIKETREEDGTNREEDVQNVEKLLSRLFLFSSRS